MLKKLCFIIPEYDSRTATHFSYLYGLIENLRQELDIFLIVEKGVKPDFLKNGNVYVQKFSFWPLKALENLLVIKYARLSGYKDFYIHYSFLSAFNASLVAKLSGGRTFYWNCGLPWLYRRSFLRDKFERLVYHLVTFLVTGTEGLKKEYSRHYDLPISKVKVMPNWIDLEKVKSPDHSRGADSGRLQKLKIKRDDLKKELNIRPDQKVILFVHRLSKRKGAHHLPEIAKRLDSIIPDSSFVILVAGDGPEQEALNLQLTTYNLQQKFRMLGWIPQNEVLKYFAIADIFILPSEEEGFPHVLLEAMAIGVPFVAFDVGGVREISPPGFSEYIKFPGDIKSFSDKIGEILRYDSERTGKISETERNWIKKFDLSVALDKFRNLLLN